jgi:hypothetical protein
MNKLISLAAIMALSCVTLRLSFDPPYRRAGLVFTDRELVVDTDDLNDEQVERLLLDPAIGIFGDSDALDRKAAEAERVAQAEAEKVKLAEVAEAERVAQAEAEKVKLAEAAEVEAIAQADAEKAKLAEAAKAEAVAQAEASKSRKGKDNG